MPSRCGFVEGQLRDRRHKMSLGAAATSCSVFATDRSLTMRRCRLTVRPFINATSSVLAPVDNNCATFLNMNFKQLKVRSLSGSGFSWKSSCPQSRPPSVNRRLSGQRKR